MNTLAAKLTYLPFVGWMFPMATQGDEELLQNHTRQAFFMASVFTGTIIVLNCMLVLTSLSSVYLRLFFVVLIYLLYLLYFILCIIGTRAVLNARMVEIPVIHNCAARLNI
jgi:hypothetical protein